MTPERLEPLRRLATEILHLRIHPRVAEIRRPGDAEPRDPSVARRQVRAAVLRGQRVPVAVVGSGHHVQHERRITHRPRHGSGDAHAVPAAEGRMLRHAAMGRLEPVDPAERGRDADGAAAVGAHRERPEPRPHRGARAAARAARRQLRIPRIARDTEERVVGHALVAELGRVGLADEDGARPLQPLDGDSILLRHVLGEEPGAAGRQHAPGEHQILDRERHAVQRPQRLARHDGHLGGQGRLAGLLGGDGAEGVEPRVQPLDPRQHRVDDLDRGDRLLPDQPGQVERGEPAEIVHGRQLGWFTRATV